MWKNLPLKGYVYTSIGFNVLTILAVLLVHGYLPPVVPLFYGLPGGAGQLVASLGLLIGPGIGILVTSLNIGLTAFTKDLFFKKTLVVSSAFVSMLITIATLKIIFLVGFF